ncbi:hypothetical protein [Thioalkalivibrio halophilus]|uniref:Uncharacterized protein n=1 Tax=Thioalkalivibrio halophilus TaxID=252474 RepID=A0A1V3A2E1_9GAMM|nr:hypothetical protein [Thioalkalivibrio halophilus]OOC11459.1 hypothetical protein B1A74_00370 [Thioalkalivibrio halophilus]
MNTRPNRPPGPEHETEQLGTRGRTRRRLGKAALGTAPVLMTLHSAPLKAAGANCMASGWVSGNTSKHDEPEECGGRTPGYWSGSANAGDLNPSSASFQNHPGWHQAVEEGEAFVSEYGFPGIGNNYREYAVEDTGGDSEPGHSANPDVPDGSSHGEIPLTALGAVAASVEVLGLVGLPHERQIIRFGMAALLNARYISGYPLSEQQVRDIVTDTLNDGYYVADSGDRLEPEQVKAFLENTMNVPTWGP